jgi:hypothetical protein
MKNLNLNFDFTLLIYCVYCWIGNKFVQLVPLFTKTLIKKSKINHTSDINYN